jgi:hypothetical protein
LRSTLKTIPLVLIACAAFAACVGGVAQDAGFTPPPNHKGQSAWIALRHQRQEANLCVPTSASIILDYFGDSISPREIKALSLHKRYTPGDTFTDFSITFFRDLIAGLAQVGYTWREEDYSDDRRGLDKGLAAVERSLDAGIPVMIDTSPGRSGHTFVVAGYSKADRALFAVDPNRPFPGTRTVGFEELDRIWTSKGVGSDVRAAVFPQRRKGGTR